LDRQEFQAKNIIGHYYLLQTDQGQKELTPQEVQQYYKSLIEVECCFRSLKSDMEIRPIRHRKANRIKAHIYLNYLALWLVKYIEKSWRGKGVTCEVPAKLKEWDRRMGLHEIWDKENNQFFELQWNQGEVATLAFEEMQEFSEVGSALPHL
jgi:transposase